MTRDVTDSESESDGIGYFFQNPKSVGYLKSDHVGFKIFDSVQLYSVVFCFLYFFDRATNPHPLPHPTDFAHEIRIRRMRILDGSVTSLVYTHTLHYLIC